MSIRVSNFVMRKMIKHIVLMTGILASHAQAAALNEYAISIESFVMYYKNTSNIGTTPSERVVYPLSVTFEYSVDRVNRLSVNLRGIDAQFNAGASGVGADIKGYQISYSWDRKIRLARNFKPWLGVGLVSGFFDNTNRLRTDSDGFIIETFPDTKDTLFSVSLNAAVEWELSRLWFFSVNTAYEIPVADGLRGLGIGAGIKYRF